MQTEGCHLVNGKIYGFHSKKASALNRRKCECGMDPILNWVSNVSYANCCQIEDMALRPTTLCLCKKQKGAAPVLVLTTSAIEKPQDLSKWKYIIKVHYQIV